MTHFLVCTFDSFFHLDTWARTWISPERNARACLFFWPRPPSRANVGWPVETKKKEEWDKFYLKIGSRAPLRPVTRNWWPLRSPLAKLASSPILGRLSPALLIRERRTGGGRRIPLLFEGQPKIVGCLPTRLMGNSRPTPFFYLLLHVIEVDGSCGPSHPWRPFPSRRLSYCASIVDNSGQHPALSLSLRSFFSRLLVIDCGILVVKIHDLPSLLSIHMRQAPKPAPAPYLIGEITNGKNSNDQRERERA